MVVTVEICGRPEVSVRAGGLGVSLRVTVTACARGHALPTCPPARQHRPHWQHYQHHLTNIGASPTAPPTLSPQRLAILRAPCYKCFILHHCLCLLIIYELNQIFKLLCSPHFIPGPLLLGAVYRSKSKANLPWIRLHDNVKNFLHIGCAWGRR